jgi:metal-responsive CopG/Arc/MetJ family transcriptional regulator
MSNVKVAVSLPESLFDRLEALAAESHVPRSRVIAAALEDYLQEHDVARLRERINAAFADGIDADERASLNAHRRLQQQVASSDEW